MHDIVIPLENMYRICSTIPLMPFKLLDQITIRKYDFFIDKFFTTFEMYIFFNQLC